MSKLQCISFKKQLWLRANKRFSLNFFPFNIIPMVVLVVVGCLMLIASDLVVVDPGGLTDDAFLFSLSFFFFFLFSAYLSGGLGVRPLQVLFMNSGPDFFFFSSSLFDSSSEFSRFFFVPASESRSSKHQSKQKNKSFLFFSNFRSNVTFLYI